MKPENFIMWLKGYIQLNGSKPDARQWQIIQDHLALVFDKKTPDRSLTQNKESSYCSKLENGGTGRLLSGPNLYNPSLVKLQNLGLISGGNNILVDGYTGHPIIWNASLLDVSGYKINTGPEHVLITC